MSLEIVSDVVAVDMKGLSLKMIRSGSTLGSDSCSSRGVNSVGLPLSGPLCAAEDVDLTGALKVIRAEACAWLLGSFSRGMFKETDVLDEPTTGSIEGWCAAMSSRYKVGYGTARESAGYVKDRMAEEDPSADSAVECKGPAMVSIEDTNAQCGRADSAVGCEGVAVEAIEDISLR